MVEEEEAVAGGEENRPGGAVKRDSTASSCSHTQGELSMLPNHSYSEWKVFNMKTDKIPNEILQSDMVGTVRHDCCCSSLSSGVRPQLKCGSQEGTLDL